MGIQLALTPTRQFNHFDEKEVENIVFHSTYNARISKCKEQRRRIAKTLGVQCNGLYVPSGKEAFTLVDFCAKFAISFLKFCGYPLYCLVWSSKFKELRI